MDFFLWSRAAVGQLIEQEYGIQLHIRSVGKYLARWSLTPQKPIKRAYEQNPEAVKAWLEDQYPGIEQRARQGGAEIYWGDETALVNTDVRGRSFASAGKTPVAMTVGGDTLRPDEVLSFVRLEPVEARHIQGELLIHHSTGTISDKIYPTCIEC